MKWEVAIFGPNGIAKTREPNPFKLVFEDDWVIEYLIGARVHNTLRVSSAAHVAELLDGDDEFSSIERDLADFNIMHRGVSYTLPEVVAIAVAEGMPPVRSERTFDSQAAFASRIKRAAGRDKSGNGEG